MTRRARIGVFAAVGLLIVAGLPGVPASGAAALGGISGRVTSAAGGAGLDLVDVQVLDGDGTLLADGQSAADGSYTVRGLPATTTGYVICASGHYRVGDGSPAGYDAVCFKNVPWNYQGTPRGATKVPVAAGVTTTGIDLTQPEFGGISGRVTGSVSGAGLSGIVVLADDGVHPASETTTGANGSYFLPALHPSTTGYTVCFIGSPSRQAFASRATPAIRSAASSLAAVNGDQQPYDNKCYQNVPYHVDARYPPGTMPVPVGRGAVAAGIDGVLELQGGISGRVTTVAGAGIPGLDVTVFDSGGHTPFTLPLDNRTGPDGSYLVDGLDPDSGYTVCFDGGTAYPSRCYRNSLWGGTPLGPPPTSRVTVRAGAITTGIDSFWAAPGGISGRVTDAAGVGLSHVDVVVTEANGFTRTADTSSTGQYAVTGLAAAAGATVCFVADADTSAGGSVPRTGYASECYRDVPYVGGRSVPRGTTGVPVTAGSVTGGVTAALGLDGAISGSVTSAAGSRPLQVSVHVYDSAGVSIGYTQTSGGSYFVNGLPASATGYRVCFSTDYDAPGGISTTGYAPQCYRNGSYNTTGDGKPGAGSTPVPVRAGRTSSGVSVQLHTGGAISGTVTAADGGPLFGVGVAVFDRSGHAVQGGQTDGSGRYVISGLAASTSGYTVCFDGTVAAASASPTPRGRKCYRDVHWAGGTAPASGATRVPVTFGQSVTGISVVLPDAGTISGTVAAAGSVVSDAAVVVFDAAHHRITSTRTAIDGTYTVSGLALSPAGYTVCFDSSSAATHYAGQCYRNVPWRPACPPPAGTVPVPITADTPAARIDVELRR